jgi:hypothetical protein
LIFSGISILPATASVANCLIKLEISAIFNLSF